MRTIIGSFILSVTCSTITLVQALSKLGGALGLIIGLTPLAIWIFILPFYVLEKRNVDSTNRPIRGARYLQ